MNLNIGYLNQKIPLSPSIDHSSLQKKSTSHITFLFKETILKLDDDLKDLLCESPSTRVQMSEKIVQQSCFYSLLKKINRGQVPLKMKVLISTILNLNEHCAQMPEDEDRILNIILACFRLLSKKGDWKSTDTAHFFEKLYRLHTLNYGNKEMTPALALVDAGLATEYLSPESQEFMDKVMCDRQFAPITTYLTKVNCNINEPKVQMKIARIAHNFFTIIEKASYQTMKNEVYDYPLINHTQAFVGMSEFRKTTIRTKYIYMNALRKLHISCIEKAKENHSIKKNSMKLFKKEVMISQQMHIISLAAIVEEEKMTIKAITVSCNHPLDSTQATKSNSNLENSDQNVHFFVQEFKKEIPQTPPDPTIPLSERPLYKFERIPNSPYIRLQKASEEVREKILHLIEEIEREINTEAKNKIIVNCTVHTAIWHQKELMLVEIIRQIGSLLSSRALYGAIKTYVKGLTNKSDIFKNKLQEVLVAVYILVTNQYLSRWYQDELLKPLLTVSFPSIRETQEMITLKEHTWELCIKDEHPFKWLLKSIMTCGYDGDPRLLTPLNIPLVKPKKSITLHFEECRELLNTALKTQSEQVVLSLVKEMVKGIVSIMKRSKEKNIFSNLRKYFKSVENFPIAMIPDIMKAEGTLQQKASRLLYTLFNLKSLNLEATEEQHNSIKAFLANGAVEMPEHIEKFMEQIAQKTISELKLPYEDKHNSCIDKAQELLLEWITNHQIIKDTKSLKKIEAAAFARLIGKAHPRASLEELSIVTDFATWLFIYDDNIEKQEQQDIIQSLHARTLSILDGEKINEMDNKLTQGFYNIIQRINKIRDTSVWKARFRRDMLEYCEATLWELNNRKKGKIPSLEEYKKYRPNTSGTKIMFDFIELLEEIAIPQEIIENNYFQELRLLGANLVNWENDILSAPKEFSNRDIHNLVFVHQAKDALNYEEAFQKTANDLSHDLAIFTKLSQEIPSNHEPYKEVIQKDINGIIDWVAAHHFWAITSPRYNSALRAGIEKLDR